MSYVLVVDDDPVTRAVVRVMASRLGCPVTEARDLTEARMALDDRAYDAVICDYALPGEVGLDLLDTHPELLDRFVLLTGTRERHELGDDRVDAVTWYVTKPLGSDELAAVLDEVLPTLPV